MQCSMLHGPSTCLHCSKELSACPLCLYCSLNTPGICMSLHHQGPNSICLQPIHFLPRFHDKALLCAHRNEPGKKKQPEFRSQFISCPGFTKKHGCVLTGMSQARRSILNSAACQSAGSALTCWGRQPGTCRGTGKMREATTSTAASVLVQLLGAPAPCCTAPKMVARRASALGDPSHLCIVVTIVVTIVVITGTCRSMCIYESCIL